MHRFKYFLYRLIFKCKDFYNFFTKGVEQTSRETIELIVKIKELILDYKTIDFFDINSPIKGNGSKMVEAILKDFPGDWQPAVVMDWSNGFWDKMRLKHNDLEWII